MAPILSALAKLREKQAIRLYPSGASSYEINSKTPQIAGQQP
jgi:hypothetical protein